MLNALTIDVEDYYQVSNFEQDVDRANWDQYESRVVQNTHRVLELVARHNVQATFFVLGWVAEHHPQLVRDIQAAGHEIGSHSYWHQMVCEQTPAQFRADLRRSRQVLEQIIGEPVAYYRAPSFSISHESLWAFEILAEEGFVADCSVFPTGRNGNGVADAEPTVHRIATNAGTLWEFPGATRKVAGLNLPISGGGYFRLYPIRFTIRWLQLARRKTGFPITFYVHPWELDPDQPRLRAGSWLSRTKHHLNLASTEQKLDVLLQHLPFGRLSDVKATLAPPDDCRFAQHKGSSPNRSATPAGNGRPDGDPSAAALTLCRSPQCTNCPFGPKNGTNGKLKCTAPMYQVVSDQLSVISCQ